MCVRFAMLLTFGPTKVRIGWLDFSGQHGGKKTSTANMRDLTG